MADDTALPVGESGAGPWALTRRGDGLTSAIVGLHGWSGTGAVVHARDTNAYGLHSATPVLEGSAAPLLVTLVMLSGDPCASHTGASATTSDDGTVDIHFPDGTRERVRRE